MHDRDIPAGSDASRLWERKKEINKKQVQIYVACGEYMLITGNVVAPAIRLQEL